MHILRLLGVFLAFADSMPLLYLFSVPVTAVLSHGCICSLPRMQSDSVINTLTEAGCRLPFCFHSSPVINPVSSRSIKYKKERKLCKCMLSRLPVRFPDPALGNLTDLCIQTEHPEDNVIWNQPRVNETAPHASS